MLTATIGEFAFCIGFDVSTPDSQMHFYLPVVTNYTRKEKIGLIIFVMRKYFAEFKENLKLYAGSLPEFSLENYAKSLSKKLQFEFVRFKHESFAPEREVRLVISGDEKSKYRPHGHRLRGNVIIPYHKTSDLIWRKDGTDIEPPKLPLSSVTIGPMNGQDLCARSVRDFLAFYGYNPTLVNVSRLPYRAH